MRAVTCRCGHDHARVGLRHASNDANCSDQRRENRRTGRRPDYHERDDRRGHRSVHRHRVAQPARVECRRCAGCRGCRPRRTAGLACRRFRPPPYRAAQGTRPAAGAREGAARHTADGERQDPRTGIRGGFRGGERHPLLRGICPKRAEDPPTTGQHPRRHPGPRQP